MTALRVALVVPKVRRATETCSTPIPMKALEQALARCDADVVVFPENFRECNSRHDVIPTVAALAKEVRRPVAAGVWCNDEQMQCAGYSNPAPKRGETREHFYAKHATSVRLAYELSDYARIRDALFTPIRLRGHQIGIMLCHDMFFGLVPARLCHEGADVLMDLTGSNVNLAKWTNVVAARSLEHQVPFFCTMSNWTFMKKTRNVAAALAWASGRPLNVVAEASDRRLGTVQVFDVAAHGVDTREQGFSPLQYTDIKLALGTDARNADIVGSLADRAASKTSAWQAIDLPVGRVGVLNRPLAALRDPLDFHRLEQDAFDHHLVLYIGEEGLSQAEALTLAKMRAIEHRIAVGVLTPQYREVVKTNRYKDIQRLRELNGVFGVASAFIDGTYAHAPARGTDGLPLRFVEDYRALMQLDG